MTNHVKAITYPPKITAVRSGACRQTIRKGSNVQVGDRILWHGGNESRVRDWMLDVVVTEAIPITIDWYVGIGRDDTGVLDPVWYPWESSHANDLAAKDFIDPPTGIELCDVLAGFYGKMEFVECQIIRW